MILKKQCVNWFYLTDKGVLWRVSELPLLFVTSGEWADKRLKTS